MDSTRLGRKRQRIGETIGRLHEQLAEGEEALAVYDAAIALTSRGNWLKRDLQERVVALHRRIGALDALVERAAAAAQAAPKDLDALELHARALREAERTDEALAALATATATATGVYTPPPGWSVMCYRTSASGSGS